MRGGAGEAGSGGWRAGHPTLPPRPSRPRRGPGLLLPAPSRSPAGIPQSCDFFANTQCTQDEKYAKLWEIPLLTMDDANDTLVATMDPGQATEGQGYASTVTGEMAPADLEALLKLNFDRSYQGNRAPFGLYIHSPWFTKGNIQATNQFLEYALSQPDTYAVTNRQLLQWMADPVPASEMDQWLTCKPTNISKPFIPGAAAGQGAAGGTRRG